MPPGPRRALASRQPSSPSLYILPPGGGGESLAIRQSPKLQLPLPAVVTTLAGPPSTKPQGGGGEPYRSRLLQPPSRVGAGPWSPRDTPPSGAKPHGGRGGGPAAWRSSCPTLSGRSRRKGRAAAPLSGPLTWINWMVSADLPTPPPPTTTSRYFSCPGPSLQPAAIEKEPRPGEEGAERRALREPPFLAARALAAAQRTGLPPPPQARTRLSLLGRCARVNSGKGRRGEQNPPLEGSCQPQAPPSVRGCSSGVQAPPTSARLQMAVERRGQVCK